MSDNTPSQDSIRASKGVAEHSYEASDYKSSLEVEQGLAATHEQVSDSYMVSANDENEIIQEEEAKS